MEAIATKLTPGQYAEKAREGLTKKKEERQELFLAGYDVAIPLIDNLKESGVRYSAFYAWLEDLNFKVRYDQKRKESLELAIQRVEDVAFRAATGEVYITTRYYKTITDEVTGEVVETPSGKAVYQQPPSFKHAEMMLKAHASDIYGRNDQGASGAITFNLNITGGADQALEIKAIDITDMQQHESNALNRGISPDNHIE